MRYKKLIITAFTLPVFCGTVVATSSTQATSITDEINVTIPASCSLTSVVGSAHTSTIETGVYQDDIGESTFKVFCNDSEGFAVYAVGFTNDEFGNNTLKPAVVDNGNAIATGTATSGNTSNWAMKLSAVSGTYVPTIHSTEENSNTYSFTNYHTIPSEYTKVASYSSNTDVTTGSSFKSTYAAFISQTQLADSYTGKVKYTVVHPSSELAPVEISQLTYMQDFKNLTSSQRVSVLNLMEYNTTYNLIDNRDNKTYKVAKLKDGNIWMAENLDLGRITLTGDLTSANTNLDANANTVTASDFNAWAKTSGTGSYTTAELIPVTGTDSTSNTPYGTLYNYCAASAGTICSADGENKDDATSDLCPAGWRLPTGGDSGEFQALYNLTDYNNPTKMHAPITGGGAAFAFSGHFYSSTPTNQGLGGYYWSSTKENKSRMYYSNFGAYDVFPNRVDIRYSGYAIRCVVKKPHSLTISYSAGVSSVQINGVIVQDGETIELEEGRPYSITMIPSAGYLFSPWSGEPGAIDSISSQTTVYTVGSSDATLTANASYVSTEMQNISSGSCTTIASYARDNRDDHIYLIQRLADGNCWMMENLDLGRTNLITDLTSNNTNLSNTITATTFNGWRKTAGTETYTAGEFIPLTTSNTMDRRDIDQTSGTSYGTLYNYCAASASTICTDYLWNDPSSRYDICPAGWRLPIGGDTGGEFSALNSFTDYNTLAKMRAPIADGGAAFALAGYFGNSTPTGQGVYGHYWSSKNKTGSTTDMNILLLYSSVLANYSSSRTSGYAVRCIMKTS